MSSILPQNIQLTEEEERALDEINLSMAAEAEQEPEEEEEQPVKQRLAKQKKQSKHGSV